MLETFKKKTGKRVLTAMLGIILALAAVMPSGFCGRMQAKADSVVDILDYEKCPSATEFAIYDIAGMEKLAELANTETDDFSGKTIRLAADLKYDKTVENNYTVICGEDGAFCGAFDGGFHTISGVNINQKSGDIGLFGLIMGDAKVSRIILKNSSIASQNTKVDNGCGGIVALMDENTEVSECICWKDVEISGNYFVGGIVGTGDGKITKCINYATVGEKGDAGAYYGYSGGVIGYSGTSSRGIVEKCVNYGTIHGIHYLGGICAIGDGTLVECCNMGKIVSEGKLSATIDGRYDWSGDCLGGIAAKNYVILNCYNVGTVTAEADELYGGDETDRRLIGGISGRVAGIINLSGEIKNSYSAGQVKNGWPGAIASLFSRDGAAKLSNCFWLSGTADIGVCEAALSSAGAYPSVFEYSQDQMRAQAFVDELNKNSSALGYGEVWAIDTENTNNGYPILKNVPYTMDDLTNGSKGDDPYIPDDGPLDTTPADHFYEDCDYAKQATNSTIQIYANGGTVAVSGTTEKKNYKRCVLYTDILPSYIYTAGKNGAVKSSSGKVIVGITATNEKPTLVKGKIVDKNTSKIASASIKSGQITVMAKSQPGNVYLWVMDTGRAAVSACIPVTVKGAPTATNIYATSDTDPSFAYGTTKQFKNGKIGIGGSVKVYLYPTYKQNGVAQKANNVKYTTSIAANVADYFSVTQSGSNPYCFEISAKALKDGKSVSGIVTFTCNLNGKRASFKATATNPVIGISTANESGLTKKADNAFSIKVSNMEKASGTFELQPVCFSSNVTTDQLKIYAMGSENGYDTAKFKEGRVRITNKKTSAQGKICMKAAKDKKTVTVTVAKGASPVTAYFLVVYNTVSDGSKQGYTVISVTTE